MAAGEALVGGKKFQVESNLGCPAPSQPATVSSITAPREAPTPDSCRAWAAAAYLGRGPGMLLRQRCWFWLSPSFCTERQLGIARPSLTDCHLVTSPVRRFHTSRQPVAFQKTCSSLAFSFPRKKAASLLNPSVKALFPIWSFFFLTFCLNYLVLLCSQGLSPYSSQLNLSYELVCSFTFWGKNSPMRNTEKGLGMAIYIGKWMSS